MNANTTDPIYKAYRAEAFSFQVNGTPSTMIINNQTRKYEVVSGAAPKENFETAFEKLSK